ncbi:SAM-dependent methyltransferase [Flexivirga caeni]|uniref:SAM-dependent methyltransferase n=1 Tax=Flexivirga caeni TaxID=2294115 RepID=A0A3M9MI18_9MICO|nr:SAM-dependent methyltransferase [Flexivirga caeni]RNI25202.1 hypothetical protein EFY87_00725 [Flexivirga caeni]
MEWRTWQDAWQEALYGPAGFYRRLEGPAGHFATSAQGIPGAGATLAQAIVALAAGAGCTRVVDVGAGRGELLAGIAAVAPELELTGVDVVERPAGLPDTAGWLISSGGRDLPAGLTGLEHALVLAHEWLDVVPCPVVEFDGVGWRHVEVDDEGRERAVAPVNAAELQWLQRNWTAKPPVRAEVGLPRDAAFRALRDRIVSGLVVVVDYGHLAAARPGDGTLTGYRDGRQCPPRPDGTTDITAHVAMDTLGADRLVSQRDLFAQLRLRPPDPPIDLAREDPAAYLSGLAARSAYAQLVAPGGLGDFWWALTAVG